MRLPPRLGLVLLAGLLVHLPYIDNGFTYQDHGDIEAGRAVRPLSSIHHTLFEPWGDTAYYRPLVTAAHSLDHALWGLWAPGYHVTNLALHLAFVAGVWLFAGRFAGLGVSGRTIAALVAAVHPCRG